MIDDRPYPVPTRDTVCSWEGYLYFVWERECIRIYKEEGNPPPYTQDKILQTYRFTNIRRRDDRITRWLIDNLIEPNLGCKDLWFKLLLARIINWPPTLNKMQLPERPEDFDPDWFYNTVERIKTEQDKVYGGAYMVYPTKKEIGKPKSFLIANYIISDVIKKANSVRRAIKSNSVANTTAALSQCYGISTFVAGQVAADLTYAEGHLKEASDLLYFAPLGPGSQIGLNYLHNLKHYHVWCQPWFNRAMTEARNYVVNLLEIDDLTLHDVQNTFCEYGKYTRTLLGGVAPKTKYRPTTEF